MVVNIQKLQKYRLVRKDERLFLEYRMPHGEAMYLPIRPGMDYRSLVNWLEVPGNAEKAYRAYRSRLANARMAGAAKKPSPAQLKGVAKKNAQNLRGYFSAKGRTNVAGWKDEALEKKHIPLRTNGKQYGIGMGYGPLEKGGKDLYTTFIVPKGKRPGIIGVTDYLSVVAGFGKKEFNDVRKRLSSHSNAWKKLLANVKAKAKSETRIRDGSLARELMDDRLAA